MRRSSSQLNRSANEYSRDQSLTQTSTPQATFSFSTIPSFQIINPESSHFQNASNAKPDPYFIDYHKLFEQKIDPFHRYKLMKWLQTQVFRQKYYREVFAYTSHYLDSYLQKSQKLELKDLQVIALAALLIATKIEGTTFPKLGKAFDFNEILEIEKKMCIKLNYFLNPKTYVHILNQYIDCWEKFIDKSKVYQKDNQYRNQSLSSFQRHRSLYQKMQFLNMAPQSHKFNKQSLIFNYFYLQNKVNMINLNVTDLTVTNMNEFINDSFEQLDRYSFIFQQFIQFGSNQIECPPLDLNIGIYVSSFISIPIGKQTPNYKCFNYQSYLKMQTVTDGAIKAVDKLIKKI